LRIELDSKEHGQSQNDQAGKLLYRISHWFSLERNATVNRRFS